MIKKLIIKNFRCYENTTISLQKTSLLVGRNNAGKSTLIEVLKVIATIVRKYQKALYVKPPEWAPAETDNGIMPNVDNLGISDRGIFYMYGNAPAIIEAHFSNGCVIKAYIGEELSVFALIIKKDGVPVRNQKEAKQLYLPPVEVLPQISVLLQREKVLEEKTVIQNLSTRLSSRHFRNQLRLYPENFPRFKSIVESTWEELQVKPLESIFVDGVQLLQFFVRNNSFEAEIAWMGHGLQMWVQCMWFISQCQKDSIVILDEPDVYMHADLQRRLIRLVEPMFSQLIIATHSIEIMEEVMPECIIPIDNKQKNIKSVGSHDLLQKFVDGMGSSFNLDLARLFVSKRFMIWEGPDIDRLILSKFEGVLFPRELHSISSYPKVYVEGWGGWLRAMAVAKIFNSNKIHIVCYCIFDSDYHTLEEIESRKQEAVKHNINLHIWERKEIENYVINPDVILRYIQEKKRKGKITIDSLQKKMQEIVESMKPEVHECIASEIQASNPKLMFSTINKLALEKTNELWHNPFNAISGKTFFKKLSSWTSREYGVTFQALNLVPFFRAEEIPDEIIDVVTAIKNGDPMS